MMQNSALPYVVLISLMWGSGYVFLKLIDGAMPPFWLTSLRLGLCVPVLLLVWALLTTERLADLRLRDAAVIATTNGWLPNVLAAMAVERLPASEAGMLHALTPVFTGLLAALLLADERLTRGILAGLAVGFLGVALIAASGEVGQGDMLGRVLMIGVALSFAAGSVYARAIKTRTPALLSASQLGLATLVALAISVVLGEARPLPGDGVAVASLVMLALFSTAAPAVLFLMLVRRHKAVRIGGVSYLQPVWAIVLGAALLGETITALQGVGLLAVLWGVWLVTKG
jgi:drug/metabolite transporter (DMT)-like permease